MPFTCQNVPVPAAYIPKKDSLARVNNFKKNKYNILCRAMGKNECTYSFFAGADFKNMMNHFFDNLKAGGVRIYFAAFSKEGQPQVPKQYGELMTIIFAPTTDVKPFKDLGSYYMIFPDSEAPFSMANNLLDKTVAREWVNNYRNLKWPLLTPTVGIPGKEDTRSIHYEKKKLVQIVNEITCQGASGITAYYSATDGNDPDPDMKSRLLIDFVLSQREGNDDVDFYIEDRDGFDNREKPGNLDTGNPCPPAHCDGELLFS